MRLLAFAHLGGNYYNEQCASTAISLQFIKDISYIILRY